MMKKMIRKSLSLLLTLALIAGAVGSGNVSITVYAAEAESESDVDGMTEGEDSDSDAVSETSGAQTSSEDAANAAEGEDSDSDAVSEISDAGMSSEDTDDSESTSDDQDGNDENGNESSSTDNVAEEDLISSEGSPEDSDVAEGVSEAGTEGIDSVSEDDGTSNEDAEEDAASVLTSSEDAGLKSGEEGDEDETEEEEAEEEEEDEDASDDSVETIEVTCISDSDGTADNDDLFYDYLFSIAEAASTPAAAADYGNSYFTEGTEEYSLYTLLRSVVSTIASSGGSSEIDASSVVFTYTSTSSGDEEGYRSYLKEIVSEVVSCLLVDCPSELYWYDKTTGYKYSFHVTSTTDTSSSDTTYVYSMYISSISFAVASAYQGSDDDGNTSQYIVDPDLASSAILTAAKALDVVNTYEGYGDYEKLEAYKEWICDAVSYNSDAASDDYADGYGDPWQIIYDSTGILTRTLSARDIPRLFSICVI